MDSDGLRRWPAVDDAAVVELDESIGKMKVAIIVADDKDEFAFSFQVGQNLRVEDALEGWVLVCGPFVKQVDGSIFYRCAKEGKALALALRKRCSGKGAVLDFNFMVEL